MPTSLASRTALITTLNYTNTSTYVQIKTHGSSGRNVISTVADFSKLVAFFYPKLVSSYSFYAMSSNYIYNDPTDQDFASTFDPSKLVSNKNWHINFVESIEDCSNSATILGTQEKQVFSAWEITNPATMTVFYIAAGATDTTFDECLNSEVTITSTASGYTKLLS